MDLFLNRAFNLRNICMDCNQFLATLDGVIIFVSKFHKRLVCDGKTIDYYQSLNYIR